MVPSSTPSTCTRRLGGRRSRVSATTSRSPTSAARSEGRRPAHAGFPVARRSSRGAARRSRPTAGTSTSGRTCQRRGRSRRCGSCSSGCARRASGSCSPRPAKAEEVEHYRELLGVGGLVDAATTSDDAASSKPRPDIFQAALAKVAPLGPGDAVVVGDTPYDAEAARKAGDRGRRGRPVRRLPGS